MTIEKLGLCNAQGLAELGEDKYGWIPYSPFDPANIGAIELRAEGEFLLRPAFLKA